MTVATQNEPCLRADVGGKAYNLMHLCSAGFNIPDFFVLGADFFKELLGDKFDTYKAYLRSFDDAARSKITELIGSCEFSDGLRTLIDEKLTEVFGSEPILFSVRSSAVDEDSSAHSFAGMLDSFLFVDRASVLDRIKACYLSCFSERIMKYRADNGLINEDIRVAVIIQKMIDADMAGVIFTADPQTNNTDEMLLSIVTGVGERLVSGECNSDDYLLDFYGSIISRPKTASVPADDELLLRLAKLAEEVEDSYEYKCPQDIEFCVKDGEIFLLQARPITTCSHINKRNFRTILDNSNIIESYSGVTTPLTFTFAREVYAKVYNQTLKSFFVKQEAIDEIQNDLQNMLCFYENKVYYRLNSWYRMTSLYPGYETNKKYMENMMGVKTVLHESRSQAKTRLLKIYLRALYKLLRIKKDSKKFKERFNRVTAPYYNNNFDGYSSKKLLAVYRELEEKILDDFITPITNDMCTMVIFGMLTDKLKKAKISDSEGLLADILSKQGNVESAKQSSRLLDIVRQIKASPSLLSEFHDSDIDTLKKKLDVPQGIYADIAEYIHLYGARTMDELKLETLTLLEDPEFLFTTLKQYLALEDDACADVDTSVCKEKEAYNSLLAACPFWERGTVSLLIKLTRFFIRNRESLRLRRTYIYSIVRKIYLGIGANLTAEGIIDGQRDIFFLTKDEISEIVEKGSLTQTDIKGKISRRRSELDASKDKPVYERMYFYGEVSAQNMLPIYSKNQFENRNGLLVGVAGGGGVIEGTVKLVEDPSDADVKGCILMAKRTDPGWTVIFPMADAVIIERGSVLSHSAVAARELGLTLVVGIRGLTDIVKDGDRVRVDGINGTVEILDKSDKKS